MAQATSFTCSSHPALCIVDMQNGFVHPTGTFGKLGLDVTPHSAPISHIRRLIDAFTAKSLPIFFFRLSFADESYSDAGIILDKIPQVKDVKGFLRGSWDAEVVDELKPTADDIGKGRVIVIDKTRNSPFYKTAFEDKLKEMKVDQLIVTGVGTNVCVEATVRDAYTYGFPAVVAREAVATLERDVHEASLKNMGSWFGDVVGLEEIEGALRKRS